MTTDILTLSKVIGAEYTSPLIPRQICRLLTDSRSFLEADGTLFFALRTGSNEGSKYIPELYAAGGRDFVIDKEMSISRADYPEANILCVDDTLIALQKAGAWVREQSRAEVVGITGSAGKTTLKEWLYQALFSNADVMRSPRSYNSQIGVPLSLWEIDPAHTQIALIEAGVSRKGEMQRLQSIIQPTVGIITNIGDAHSKAFVSNEEKCAEKCRLFTQAKAVVYNSDDSVIFTCIDKECGDSVKRLNWSACDTGAYVYIESRRLVENGTEITYRHNGNSYVLNVPGKSDADQENALHSLALLLYLGFSPKKINYMLGNVAYFGTRIEVEEGCNGCIIVSDSYTNDCHSLQQALEFMKRRSGNQQHNRSTAIITDLVAESAEIDAIYSSVADILGFYGVTRLIGIGRDISSHALAFSGVKRTDFYENVDDFIQKCPVSEFADEQILVKGRGEFEVQKILEHLEARRNETVLEVNLDALADNYNAYRELLKPDTGIICMIKASGYGAGSYELAKTLQDRGAAYLAVAVVDEGADLRNAGITMPIMVMNPRLADYRSLFTNRLEPEIYSLEMCRDIIETGRRLGVSNYPVHIKIDSGMHRLGFRKEQLPALIDVLRGQDTLMVKSVFTHLCVADEDTPSSNEYTCGQLDYYEECAEILQGSLPGHKILRHALNSAGIVRFNEKQFDMVRLGIGMYGIAPCDMKGVQLRPVSALHTIIISVKEWQPGTTIGYGRKGIISRQSRIATIPVGYADGLDRRCGNGKVSFVVGGVKCPTVGNICMDACMIDVTDVLDCKVGSRVEIFGLRNPVTDIADAIGTIPYEILTSVSPRVKRIYYRE